MSRLVYRVNGNGDVFSKKNRKTAIAGDLMAAAETVEVTVNSKEENS